MTDQEKTSGKREEAREVAEFVKVFEKLPEAEREKVFFMLKGFEFAAVVLAGSDQAAS